MRAFIAVPLSGEIRSSLGNFMEELGAVKGIRMVPPENLHLTLDFLGETDESELSALNKKLKAVAENHEAFSLSVHGVGTFPKTGEAIVVWAGLKKNDSLTALALSVRKATDSRDQKKFSPHLTVGRVKFTDERQKAFWETFYQAEHRDFGMMKVDRFLLMKSDLSGKTPVYTAVNQFILKDGEKNG